VDGYASEMTRAYLKIAGCHWRGRGWGAGLFSTFALHRVESPLGENYTEIIHRQNQSHGMRLRFRELPDLLAAAEKGRATIITRHGRPVAALVPIGACGAAVRLPSLLPLKGSGRGLWGGNKHRDDSQDA
jgi:hypothetical protein